MGRDWLYFLVDGIYPCWSVFVKTNNSPTTQRETKFAKQQEHVRKDVERCFGVLVKRFGILKRQLRGWYMEDIKTLIYCCVVLHNMTQEVRRDNYKFNDEIEWENDNEMETGEVESIFWIARIRLATTLQRHCTLGLHICVVCWRTAQNIVNCAL